MKPHVSTDNRGLTCESIAVLLSRRLPMRLCVTGAPTARQHRGRTSSWTKSLDEKKKKKTKEGNGTGVIRAGAIQVPLKTKKQKTMVKCDRFPRQQL